MKTLWLSLIAVFAAVTIGMADADAKRLGGGKSIGKQAPSSTIQRDATPSAPAGPASQAAAPRAGAAAAAGGSRWMAPLAGLAAGLGLAALASYLGFGEELATFLLIALVVMAVLVAVRMFMARKAAAARPPAFAGGAAYTGLGQGTPVSPPTSAYQPGSVLDTTRGGSAGAGSAALNAAVVAPELPAGFDADGFVRQAKVYFVRLQAAFDAADTNDLREFTSPEMFAELKMQIDERNGASNHTEVVSIHARLLGVETSATEYLASVRFTGVLREQADAAATPYDEVWNFTRTLDGKGGWVLGGIQQLDPQ